VDVCPAVPDPAQGDADGDGRGDACADGVPPPGGGGEPERPDADDDGTPDGVDPCPGDAACGPPAAPTFAGGPGRRASERLLAYLAPAAARTSVAADASATVIALVVAPDVRAGSVSITVGGRRRSDLLGTVVPGTTKTVAVPLDRRRTVVRFSAQGPRVGRRRTTDRDTLVFVKQR
jgi:hypothetical protein